MVTTGRLLYSVILAFIILIRTRKVNAILSVHCERGHSLRDPQNPLLNFKCSSSGGEANKQCPSGFSCVFDVCCPTPAQICAQPRSVGRSCSSAEPTQRFVFDASSGICREFHYNGCFGNDNNFETRAACEGYCIQAMCPKGMPVIIGDQVYRCSQTSPCGPNYDCISSSIGSFGSICCPTPSYICSMGPDGGQTCPGDLTPELQLRYFYNPTTSHCHMIEYLGCNGSENNFESEAHCMEFCSPPTAENVCPPGRKPALLGSLSPMTCHATDADACIFGYSCTLFHGNGRQYCCSGDPETASLTENGRGNGQRLGAICPNGDEPFMEPERNQLPKSCQQNDTESCPSGYSCQIGKGINGAAQICCKLARDASMLQHASVGYNPCPYGQTPFIPAGSAAQRCMPTNFPGLTCPSGYNCIESIYGASNGHYCCSQSAIVQFCPLDSSPQISELNGSPQACYPLAPVCRPGFVCRLGPMDQYYCCTGAFDESPPSLPPQSVPSWLMPPPSPQSGISGSIQGSVVALCPGGTAPQLLPDSLVKSCSPHILESCQQPAFRCVIGTTGFYMCCQESGALPHFPLSPATQTVHSASASASSLCPSATTPYLSSSDTPKTCSASNSYYECPHGYSCQQGASGFSFCCSNPVARYCPSPHSYLDHIQGSPAPRPCTLAIQDCRLGFSCQLGPAGSYCCSNPNSFINQQNSLIPSVTVADNFISSAQDVPFCSGNGKPYVYPGRTLPQICDPAQKQHQQCPPPYSCQYSPRGVGICCSQEGDCPRGVPVLLPTQQPWVCNRDPSISSCPAPAVCMFSEHRRINICCLDLSDYASTTTLNQPHPQPLPYPGYQPSPQSFGPHNGMAPNNNGLFSSGMGVMTGNGRLIGPGKNYNNHHQAPNWTANGTAGTTVDSGDRKNGKLGVGQSLKLATTPKPQRHTTPAIHLQLIPGSARDQSSSWVPRVVDTEDIDCPKMIQGLNCGWNRPEVCPGGFKCEFVVSEKGYFCCKNNSHFAFSVNIGRRSMNDAPETAPDSRSLADNETSLETVICNASEVAVTEPESRNITCQPALGPGETGCNSFVPCRQSLVCIDETCKCSKETSLFNNICVPKCPKGTEAENGICRHNKVINTVEKHTKRIDFRDLKRIVYQKPLSTGNQQEIFKTHRS